MAKKVFYSLLSNIEIPEDVTLAHCILQRAKHFGNKIALIDGVDGRRYTYSDVIEMVGRVTSGFIRNGVQKGDVIQLCIPNCIEYPVIILAATSLGAIITPSNPVYTTDELYAQMKDSGAKYVISSQDAAERVQEASNRWGKVKARFVLGMSDGFHSFADIMKGHVFYQPAVKITSKEDIAVLPYSSGTSGKPKGVMLTHYNLLSNIYQSANPYNGFDANPGQETYLAVLPFYHMYGILVIQLYGLFQGNTIVIFPKFELESFLTAIQKYKVTLLHIVPPIAVMLSKNPLVDNFDISSVQNVFCGAAPMDKELTVGLMNTIKIKNIRQGYGMTEASAMIFNSPQQGWRHGSVGVLIPNTLCRIVDVETGKDLDVGQEGELWFKGPQMMKGYLGRPDATAATVDKDGWLHTGDIVRVDEDGHYFVVDRLKELIKYKGRQVAPAELEGLLLNHPAIADAAVIGVPNVEAGELPRAFCVIKSGSIVTKGDILKFANDQIAPHKRLRGGVEFIAEIPKSASGKILRRILRDKVKNIAKANL